MNKTIYYKKFNNSATISLLIMFAFIFLLNISVIHNTSGGMILAKNDGQSVRARFIHEKNIPIIQLASTDGNYYKLGKAHGELIREIEKDAGKKIEKFISHERLRNSDIDLDYRINVLAKNLPQRYKDEIRGFADGIDSTKGKPLTYKDILFMNLIGDATRARVMCTGAAFGRKATADGNALIGRNLDWIDMETFHRISGITAFRIKNNGFALIGVTGLSADTTGVNRHGVFVAVLSAIQKKDMEFRGHDSVNFAIRTVTEDAKDAGDALKILKDKHFPYSCIFLVGDKKTAYVLEKSGKKYAIRKGIAQNPDITIVTNHFTKLKNDSKEQDSTIRYRDMIKETKKKGWTPGVAGMEELLSLCKNKNHPVYRRLTQKRINKYSTLLSIIFKPDNLNTWIWFARKIPADKKPVYVKIEMGNYLMEGGK